MVVNVRRPRAALLACLVVGGLAQPVAGQLASRTADEWIKLLDSPARVAQLKVDEVIAKLALKPGDVVADLGAGSGVFSLPLAQAVGATGKVYAVDVDQGLVDHIGRKAKAQNVTNVYPVLGKFGDPALPATDVDVAFLHDVLHHIEDRPGYLKQAARYLKPAGRIAFVEPDAVKGPHANDPKLQVTKADLQRWMAEVGFVPSNEFTLFNDKWYVVYARR
jgi:ubiquinone/menaquinone biosynthesis C-methylase UbiE